MYDKGAKIAILSKITSETSKRNNAEQNQNSAEHEQNEETQEEIINILKKQLDRSYEEKKELTRALNKAQQLVNQQQQLTLSTNNELKTLKIELKEKKKKKRLFNIFHTKE